jgi:hypothetical protein
VRAEPDMETTRTHSLRERALEELKAYWFITLYLWLFLGCFTVYRRLILAESGVAYLNYGVALIEALVIAKVVLIGRIFGFTRRFDDAPLAVPVLYKSIVFALLVMLFGVVEHLVVGWFHRQGLVGGLREIAETGAYEIGARTLMLTVAFVLFFAFTEIGRRMGMERLRAMFFSPERKDRIMSRLKMIACSGLPSAYWPGCRSATRSRRGSCGACDRTAPDRPARRRRSSGCGRRGWPYRSTPTTRRCSTPAWSASTRCAATLSSGPMTMCGQWRALPSTPASPMTT